MRDKSFRKFLTDIDWVNYNYFELDRSQKEIAAELGTKQNVVSYYFAKLGIKKEAPTRGHQPQQKFSCSYCQKEFNAKVSNIRTEHPCCSRSCASKFYINNTEKGQKQVYEMAAKSFDAQQGKRTSIEVKMAEELFRRGIEYIEQYNLGDKFALDFFLPEYQIVVECDGDYWHRLPKNVARDKSKNAYVKACGYSIYRFWESEINTDVEACVDVIFAEINERRRSS